MVYDKEDISVQYGKDRSSYSNKLSGQNIVFISPTEKWVKNMVRQLTDIVIQIGEKVVKYSSFNTCTKINFGGQRTLCKIKCVKLIGENEGKIYI